MINDSLVISLFVFTQPACLYSRTATLFTLFPAGWSVFRVFSIGGERINQGSDLNHRLKRVVINHNLWHGCSYCNSSNPCPWHLIFHNFSANDLIFYESEAISTVGDSRWTTARDQQFIWKSTRPTRCPRIARDWPRTGPRLGTRVFSPQREKTDTVPTWVHCISISHYTYIFSRLSE